MPRDSDQFDFFVSYARKDNLEGWISRFVEELLAEHAKFSGGRALVPFFDKADIRGLDDWQHRLQSALATSRLFLAFISPAYFASEWCRREWRSWIDLEIAKHILSAGVAPVYIVEVPGLFGNDSLSEREVAEKIAGMCALPFPRDAFLDSAPPVVRQLRRRQFNVVQPFFQAGLDALRHEQLRRVLENLARDLDERAGRVRRAADSESTVPPYNKRFSGRLDELLELRARLTDDRAGVITGVHGLGGMGKTELAFTYAHAFASAYPGGRFLVPCEGKPTLRDAALHLGELFRDRITDEERKTPDSFFAAIASGLRDRLDRLGHILLVLDNVTGPALVSAQQTDALTSLGPRLHLLATTRLPAAGGGHIAWLTLGELREADALEVLEKHRAFANETERAAARRIVRRLGGFALATELVAAWLREHVDVSCAAFAGRLGLEDFETLDALADDDDVELRRHNHERRLEAVLAPTLADLRPPERRALEYAACLAPDCVPLPWLRELVGEDFPEIAQPPRPGFSDAWSELCRRLWRLGLFSRHESGTSEPRLVRVHRLVQDVVRRGLAPDDFAERRSAVGGLVAGRDVAMERTTNWSEARWELEPLEALAWVLVEAGDPMAALFMTKIGLRWLYLAEWARAEPLMRRALQFAEQRAEPDPHDVMICLNNLALVLEDTNRLAEAETLMRRALEIAGRLGSAGQHEAITALANLGRLLRAMDRLNESVALLRRALELAESAFGPDDSRLATILNNLALALQDADRHADTEPLLRRSLEIDTKNLGPDHPDVATALSNLAVLLHEKGGSAEAEPMFRRALEINERNLGPDHPAVAHALGNLGLLLKETDRASEAEPLYRRALEIVEASFGASHPSVAVRLANLAMLLADTDRVAEAEPLLRRALAIDETSLGPGHSQVIHDLHNLAQLLEFTGRAAEAEPLLQRVARIFLQLARGAGDAHATIGPVLKRYGGVLLELGLTEGEARAKLDALAAEYGLTLREEE